MRRCPACRTTPTSTTLTIFHVMRSRHRSLRGGRREGRHPAPRHPERLTPTHRRRSLPAVHAEVPGYGQREVQRHVREKQCRPVPITCAAQAGAEHGAVAYLRRPP